MRNCLASSGAVLANSSRLYPQKHSDNERVGVLCWTDASHTGACGKMSKASFTKLCHCGSFTFEGLPPLLFMRHLRDDLRMACFAISSETTYPNAHICSAPKPTSCIALSRARTIGRLICFHASRIFANSFTRGEQYGSCLQKKQEYRGRNQGKMR